MLLEALKEIHDMPYFSISKLAASLNIDKNTANHVVELLKQTGYIKEEIISTSCSNCHKSCIGCSFSKDSSKIKTISITKKGRQVLETNTVN